MEILVGILILSSVFSWKSIIYSEKQIYMLEVIALATHDQVQKQEEKR